MWSQEKTLKLIELWQSTPILWDSKHKDYRNRDLKKMALEDLAGGFNLTSLDIEKKMTGLKNQFRREHNKMKQNNPSSVYSVEWFGYRPLLFLLDSFTTRESWELLHGKKEFPELRKSSSDLCLENDIFLSTESNLLEMKEEREDPPPSVSSENEEQHDDLNEQPTQNHQHQNQQEHEREERARERDRERERAREREQQLQQHQQQMEEDVSIFQQQNHHTSIIPPSSKRKKNHHHHHHHHQSSSNNSLLQQYLEPLAILKTFPSMEKIQLNPENFSLNNNLNNSNNDNDNSNNNKNSLSNTLSSLTSSNITSITPSALLSAQSFINRSLILEDIKPDIKSNNQPSSSAATLGSTTSSSTLATAHKLHNQINDRDEYSVYGDYVANCLRKYHDHHSVLVAQNKINNILFDGAIGRFSAFVSAHSSCNNPNENNSLHNQLHRNQTISTLLSECSSTKRD